MRKIELNDFACSCGDHNKELCKEVKQWAFEFLAHPDYPDHKITDSNFLSQVVYYLSGYYQGWITGIPNPGGWSAVEAESSGGKIGSKQNVDIKTYIQCDNVEDGIAFTLRAFYDFYGKMRVFTEDEDDVSST
jgi:hypothetical protein